MSLIIAVQRITSRPLSRTFDASSIALVRASYIAVYRAFVTPAIARSHALCVTRWRTRTTPRCYALRPARCYRVTQRACERGSVRPTRRVVLRLGLRVLAARHRAVHRAAYPRIPSPVTARALAPQHTLCAPRVIGRCLRPTKGTCSRGRKGVISASCAA